MTIRGTAKDDYLGGTPAGETINGRGGDDVIDGREGADVLVGGKGRDTFLFRADQIDRDIVLDFKSGKDRIIVEGAEGETVSYSGGDLSSFIAHFDVDTGFTFEYGPVFATLIGGPGTLSGHTDLIII